MQTSAIERGYLNEHFRLFHTRDQANLCVDWHYHTFDKLVFFLSGNVNYSVESENYTLRPGDLLLIARGQLHRMHSHGNTVYERIILYLDSSYLASLAAEAGGLNTCFIRARQRTASLLRLNSADCAAITTLLQKLERALNDPSPYAPALAEALLTELMIFLCRASEEPATPPQSELSDEKIASVLSYIQAHLGEDLSCSTLAAHLYISRSSFQHRFKQSTGYSPHAYIRLKRLLRAAELLAEGTPAIQVGKMCGYTDHSAFCHAFTRQYGVPPSLFRPRDGLEMQNKTNE